MSHLGTVVIGGGSGFVGRALRKELVLSGYNTLVISRKPQANAITWSDLASHGLRGEKNITAVVNLAGQNFLDPSRRWTEGFKQNVIASRVNTTAALAQAITQMEEKPKVFISTSGIGYYKAHETEEYTEDSVGGDFDFFSELCTQWESASSLPDDINVRRVIIRLGVVLGRSGGMIQRLFWPYYCGLGGPIGSGSQPFPWIHILDAVRLYMHAIENPLTGVYNGVSPNLINNAQFSQAFGRAMWRPAFIPMPHFVPKLIFGHERAKVMTEGQKVIPKRTVESGFEYEYSDINDACKQFSFALYAADGLS